MYYEIIAPLYNKHRDTVDNIAVALPDVLCKPNSVVVIDAVKERAFQESLRSYERTNPMLSRYAALGEIDARLEDYMESDDALIAINFGIYHLLEDRKANIPAYLIALYELAMGSNYPKLAIVLLPDAQHVETDGLDKHPSIDLATYRTDVESILQALKIPHIVLSYNNDSPDDTITEAILAYADLQASGEEAIEQDLAPTVIPKRLSMEFVKEDNTPGLRSFVVVDQNSPSAFTVIRDDETIHIEREEVVVGDILVNTDSQGVTAKWRITDVTIVDEVELEKTTTYMDENTIFMITVKDEDNQVFTRACNLLTNLTKIKEDGTLTPIALNDLQIGFNITDLNDATDFGRYLVESIELITMEELGDDALVTYKFHDGKINNRLVYSSASVMAEGKSGLRALPVQKSVGRTVELSSIDIDADEGVLVECVGYTAPGTKSITVKLTSQSGIEKQTVITPLSMVCCIDNVKNRICFKPAWRLAIGDIVRIEDTGPFHLYEVTAIS